jgi:RimJ/RimL family protein N-acetyltransferase
MINYNYGVSLDTIDKASEARTWRNERGYNQYFRQVGLITEMQQEDWLLKIQNTETVKMYAIMINRNCSEYFNGDFCIGVCGLTSIDWINRKAEISCYTEDWVYENEKAALQTITAHGFNDLNLNRLYTETFETHTLHLKILPEIGFKEEGRLRQAYYKDGKYIDSIIHSILRSDHV